jgi:hypothetical protein
VAAFIRPRHDFTSLVNADGMLALSQNSNKFGAAPGSDQAGNERLRQFENKMLDIEKSDVIHDKHESKAVGVLYWGNRLHFLPPERESSNWARKGLPGGPFGQKAPVIRFGGWWRCNRLHS